ncbi:MAG: adenylate/guanylate cyclase domain-containing protein [Planctomycetota bacterium]
MSTAGDTVTFRPELAVDRRQWSWYHRHALLLVGVSPILANIIGSVFNILYNKTQTDPLLSAAQQDRFYDCWTVFNVLIYPAAVLAWVLPIWWLRGSHRKLIDGIRPHQDVLQRAQRYVVNLPWWIFSIASAAWLLCVPVFWAALKALPEPLPGEVSLHLTLSFVIAGMIAITHSFFVTELVSQKALYPVFFRRENPAHVPGALPLSITARGVLWALSGGVCPLISLLLLLLVPHDPQDLRWFAVAVVVVATLFNLGTAWMIGKLVATPVAQLRRASARIAEGDLDVRVNLLRADDFGPLIERFNLMVEGLRDREQLQETFGRHVGEEAAQQILAHGGGLSGAEQHITAMFVDVRNFTEHSERHTPEEVVSALNIFFRDAVETIEAHGGMVNKFLGDGFMALFGIGSRAEGHARRAVEAGLELLCCLEDAAEELERAGWPGLAIGIGVNTGPAIVGSIGSPKRLEYTAIGDTVNVAARVEALTKHVGRPLVVTESTHAELPVCVQAEELPPQPVKGKGLPLRVFAVTGSSPAAAEKVADC